MSAGGLRQAQAAAARIAALGGVAAVYSSPMERTTETAAPIAEACGLRTTVRDDLNECDFGEWTGRKLEELRKLPAWRVVQRSPSVFRFPGGESFMEMQARATGALAEIAASHRGKAVVVVSHADVIKAVAAAAIGTPLDLFQRIVISPCSITAIAYHREGTAVVSLNNVGGSLQALALSAAA